MNQTFNIPLSLLLIFQKNIKADKENFHQWGVLIPHPFWFLSGASGGVLQPVKPG